MFLDPGLLDAHTVAVDWGDGTMTSGVTLVAGAAPGSWTLSASHVYGGGGLYTVTLVVDDGAAAVAAGTTAKVAGARLRSDGSLQIIGTSDADRVDVKRQGKKLVVKADFLAGGEVVYDYASVNSIEVDLAGGADRLNVTGAVGLPVLDLEQQSSISSMLKSFGRKVLDMFPNLLR